MFLTDVTTGSRIPCRIHPARRQDLLQVAGRWKFRWAELAGKSQVFKLVANKGRGKILGMISLVRRQDHIEVALLENSPENVGRAKILDGIAGHLLAHAAVLSFESGFGGHVLLVSKTALVDHYRDHYGFLPIGGGRRMYLDAEAAARLIARFPPGGVP